MNLLENSGLRTVSTAPSIDAQGNEHSSEGVTTVGTAFASLLVSSIERFYPCSMVSASGFRPLAFFNLNPPQPLGACAVHAPKQRRPGLLRRLETSRGTVQPPGPERSRRHRYGLSPKNVSLNYEPLCRDLSHSF
jgi:hypothetical protein